MRQITVGKKVVTAEQEALIEKLYLEKNSRKVIAEAVGLCVGTVSYVLTRKGINGLYRGETEARFQREEKAVQMYLDGFDMDEIITTTKVTEGLVYKRLKELGLSIRRITKKHTMNHDFFEVVDNDGKGYMLGFLISDGCINKSNNSIKIEIQQRDDYILTRFTSLLEGTQTIRTTREIYSVIEFASIKMTTDLQKYGVVPKKSLITYFPALNSDDAYRGLIRGLFDGDGCIHLNESGGGRYLSCYYLLFGTRDLLEGVSKFVEERLGIKYRPAKKIKDKNVYSLLYSSKQEVCELSDYIYEKSNGLYLTRKKDKLDKVKEFYEIRKAENFCRRPPLSKEIA